jgi:hypothetical protein
LPITAPIITPSDSPQIVGVPDDWTHHHLKFSNPGTEAQALEEGRSEHWSTIINEPRYIIQQMKQNVASPGAIGATVGGGMPIVGPILPPIGNPIGNPIGGPIGGPIRSPIIPPIAIVPPEHERGGVWTMNVAPAGVAASASGSFSAVAASGSSLVITNGPNTLTINESASTNGTCSGNSPWTTTFADGTSGTSSTYSAGILAVLGAGTQCSIDIGVTASGTSPNLTLTANNAGNLGNNIRVTWSGTSNFSPAWSNTSLAGNISGVGTGAFGSAGVGYGQYPAKYSFGTGGSLTTANCDSATTPDYVVYNTGLPGSGTQANVIAYDNIYVGCSTSSVPIPNVYWAYHTGSGSVVTSPVLSLDGTKVAFIETPTSGAATLRIVQWKRGDGSAYSSPIAPATTLSNTYYGNSSNDAWNTTNCPASGSCMISVTFQADLNPDFTSSPFYDYSTDTLYVGDNSGYLHKFAGVFNGTTTGPGECTSSNATGPCAGTWPASVTTGAAGSPVYDITSGYVYIGPASPSGSGALKEVLASSGAVTAGPVLATPGSTEFVDTPLVDPSAEMLYAFVNDSSVGTSGEAAVYQLNISAPGFTGAYTETSLNQGATTGNAYAGTFDNAYYTTPGSGHLYVCGRSTSSQTPTLYQIPITGSNNTTMGTATTGPALAAGTTDCSPITEFYNGTSDYIFLSVQGNNLTTSPISCPSGSGCLMSFNVTNPTFNTSFAPSHVAVQTGGTSGLIIDNQVTTPETGSQIYFTPLLTATTCAGTTSTGASTTTTLEAAINATDGSVNSTANLSGPIAASDASTTLSGAISIATTGIGTTTNLSGPIAASNASTTLSGAISSATTGTGTTTNLSGPIAASSASTTLSGAISSATTGTGTTTNLSGPIAASSASTTLSGAISIATTGTGTTTNLSGPIAASSASTTLSGAIGTTTTGAQTTTLSAAIAASSTSTTLSGAIGTTTTGAQTTTTTGAITTTTQTTVTVTSAANAVVNGYIEIGTELMEVTNIAGTTLTITRGAFGTTAATHTSGATVTFEFLVASATSYVFHGYILVGSELMQTTAEATVGSVFSLTVTRARFTTTAAAQSAGATVNFPVLVASAASIVTNGYIAVGTELIQVTSSATYGTANGLLVNRGQYGTTAATHASAATATIEFLVASATNYVLDGYILVGSELMEMTASTTVGTATVTSLTVTRGAFTTTAAAQSSGATVAFPVLVASDVNAVLNGYIYIGTELMQITATPAAAGSVYALTVSRGQLGTVAATHAAGTGNVSFPVLVANTSSYVANGYILVGSELMQTTATATIGSVTSLTVTRGALTTTAAAQSAGATVNFPVLVASDVNAVLNGYIYIGTELMQITATPAAAGSVYALTVSRGQLGTTAATHAAGTGNVSFPVLVASNASYALNGYIYVDSELMQTTATPVAIGSVYSLTVVRGGLTTTAATHAAGATVNFPVLVASDVNAVLNGYIYIGTELMQITATPAAAGSVYELTVSRGQLGTTAAAQSAGTGNVSFPVLVANTSSYVANGYILVGSELMQTTATATIGSVTSLTVTRGALTTTAAAQSAGATVAFPVLVASEVNAVLNGYIYIGTELMQITATPAAAGSVYALTVSRGQLGTVAATHAAGTGNVSFPVLVANTSSYVANGYILVGSELMQTTATATIGSVTSLTVTRGALTTTAAAQSAGATVAFPVLVNSEVFVVTNGYILVNGTELMQVTATPTAVGSVYALTVSRGQLGTTATAQSAGTNNVFFPVLVASGTNAVANGYILVGSELMETTAGSALGSVYSLTVTRGALGTTAAAQSQSATVTFQGGCATQLSQAGLN